MQKNIPIVKRTRGWLGEHATALGGRAESVCFSAIGACELRCNVVRTNCRCFRWTKKRAALSARRLMRSTKLAVLYCTVDITGSTNRKGSNRPFRSREADSRRSNGRDVGVVSPSKPRVRCSGQRTAKDEFTGRTGSLVCSSGRLYSAY